MARRWLHEAVHREASRVAVFGAAIDGPLWLWFRRGEIAVTASLVSHGDWERVPLSVPRDKAEGELREWMLHELRNLPCHP